MCAAMLLFVLHTKCANAIDAAASILWISLQSASDRSRLDAQGQDTIEWLTTSSQVLAFVPVLRLLLNSYLSLPVVPSSRKAQ